MPKAKLSFSLFAACLFIAAVAWSQNIPPIVSTEWLSQNLGDPSMVVLDIRSAEQYKKGHIPGAINSPFKVWAVEANGLDLELPTDQALADLLGKLGIKDGNSNSIVIVNRTETDFSRADATRVAWTCKVAGLKNVAVLDGGYTKWAKENRAKSTDDSTPNPQLYKGIVDRSSVASKYYVLSKIGKSVILDTRTPEDYFGISSKPGHIKSAVSLPTPWIFSTAGVFKEEADLRAMVKGVIGKDDSKEVLVYCGVGGYSSTWWYLLTQVFGYKNVKMYDGSMEEWIKDPNAPVSSYSWK